MNAFVPSGLNVKNSRDISKRIRELGFNCVRLNWSVEMFLTNPIVNSDAINGLKGVLDGKVHAMQVFDQVVSDLSLEGVMVNIFNYCVKVTRLSLIIICYPLVGVAIRAMQMDFGSINNGPQNNIKMLGLEWRKDIIITIG